MRSQIFREYDIRGLHETDLTDETAEAVGRAFASLIRREGGRRIVLGRDVRPSSVRLAEAIARGALAAGVDVEAVGLVPTPRAEELAPLLSAIRAEAEVRSKSEPAGGFAIAFSVRARASAP